MTTDAKVQRRLLKRASGSSRPSLFLSGMSEMGQSRRFDPLPATSGLPRSTDVVRPVRLVRFVPTAEVAVS